MAFLSNLPTMCESVGERRVLEHCNLHDHMLGSCGRYYNTYLGWVRPVINLICDSTPSTAYEETQGVSANPEVVNAPGCTTNYCSVVINWRTPAACSGGGIGWTIVVLISVAAGLYVGGGIGYTRYENGHWDASDGKILAAHPHWKYWQELPDLVRDGIFFTKHVISRGAVGGKNVDSSSWNEHDELLDEAAPSSRPASPAKEGALLASEKKKKKKKRKQKPRPSKPTVSLDAGGGKE